MDLTQIGLGATLLAFSGVTLLGPSVVGSHALVYPAAALIVGMSALLVGLATDVRS
ncbi:hypothetical protein ACFQGT_06860 [Natrialbaceae archaeon GCM10025810]|uniref:hypothetical protein n=1 Tax=Halovalidus salilacus TaxID=3075124 RepID=UPI00361BF678